MKIRKGDTVKILTGKDRGKSGKVIKVFLKDGKVTVQGVNVYKKHSRPKRQGEKGEVVDVVRPVAVSNVMIICPKCNKATQVGHRVEGGIKARYCKRCNTQI